MPSPHKVTYKNNDGTTSSAILGSFAMATIFAKSRKGATIAPVDGVVAPVVHVTACPTGTLEAQRAASKAFYRGAKSDYAPGHDPRDDRREIETSEGRAERMMEHFAGCAMGGVSSEVAMDDWNYLNGNGTYRGRR